MHGDPGAMRALTQRVAGPRGQGGIDGPAKLPGRGELVGEPFQGLQSELTEMFALDKYPVLVPVVEEVPAVRKPMELGHIRRRVPVQPVSCRDAQLADVP